MVDVDSGSLGSFWWLLDMTASLWTLLLLLSRHINKLGFCSTYFLSIVSLGKKLQHISYRIYTCTWFNSILVNWHINHDRTSQKPKQPW